MNDPRAFPRIGASPPRQPAVNAPPATLALCLLLLVSYLASRYGGVWPGTIGGLLAFDAEAFRAQFAPAAGLRLWPLLSLPGHALLHADFGHFLINALMLLAFGSMVERALGAWLLVTLFVLGAVAGALALALAVGDGQAYLIGASDAGHAITGAAALILRRRGSSQARRTGAVLLAFLVGINLLIALAGGAVEVAGFRIGWQAHLGGLAAGVAVAAAVLARRGG
jgi:membrane associated rhomboid family serine protease